MSMTAVIVTCSQESDFFDTHNTEIVDIRIILSFGRCLPLERPTVIDECR